MTSFYERAVGEYAGNLIGCGVREAGTVIAQAIKFAAIQHRNSVIISALIMSKEVTVNRKSVGDWLNELKNIDNE